MQTADVLIVGAGVGGTFLARELARSGAKVTILERGRRHSVLGNWRAAQSYYASGGLLRSAEGVLLDEARMLGGTAVVSCGNAVAMTDTRLEAMGIALERELVTLAEELHVAAVPDTHIGCRSRLIVASAKRLGIDMSPMPKFIDFKRCSGCGLCVYGCPRGAKWSPLEVMDEAAAYGAHIVTDTKVEKIAVRERRVQGIETTSFRSIRAGTVVACAGGIETASLLRRSGIRNAGTRLFVDQFRVTYGQLEAREFPNELTMAAVYMNRADGYLLSPFVFPKVAHALRVPAKRLLLSYPGLLGIMTKIRDDNVGRVHSDGRIEKAATANDCAKLERGHEMATTILAACGVKQNTVFRSRLEGAHPGGTAAIGEVVDEDLATSQRGLYVCDASVLPHSPGAPPIMLIAALAKRLAVHLLGGPNARTSPPGAPSESIADSRTAHDATN